jgi:ubiquitin-protein ligase
MGSHYHRVPPPIPNRSEHVLISRPENTLYEGGLFKVHLTFPHDYPLQPPKMMFKTEIWHPNVYPSGLVCISILHPPEEDKYGYEDAGERWMPVHTPQTILLSVISMVRSFLSLPSWREGYDVCTVLTVVIFPQRRICCESRCSETMA